MRTGILGGSFNPPHLGHLLLAESALQDLALDRVLFVPASQSPFKPGLASPDAATRCEMVALAISDNPRFALDTFEAERGGTSYTIDTVRHLRARHPVDALFLLLGADAFSEFPLWKSPEEIADAVTLAVATRPGCAMDLAAHPFGAQARCFPMPAVDIASSDIRRRVAEGRSVRYLVPWTVMTFLEATALYRSPS
jgi:nicotinate-nucleotide adenylyltransferase